MKEINYIDIYNFATSNGWKAEIKPEHTLLYPYFIDKKDINNTNSFIIDTYMYALNPKSKWYKNKDKNIEKYIFVLSKTSNSKKEDIIFAIKNMTFPLPGFLCKHCGNCCTKNIPIEHNDVLFWKKNEDKNILSLLRENKHEKGIIYSAWVNNIVDSDLCPFLCQNKCSIYDKRPRKCMNFPISVSDALKNKCKAYDINITKKEINILDIIPFLSLLNIDVRCLTEQKDFNCIIDNYLANNIFVNDAKSLYNKYGFVKNNDNFIFWFDINIIETTIDITYIMNEYVSLINNNITYDYIQFIAKILFYDKIQKTSFSDNLIIDLYKNILTHIQEKDRNFYAEIFFGVLLNKTWLSENTIFLVPYIHDSIQSEFDKYTKFFPKISNFNNIKS